VGATLLHKILGQTDPVKAKTPNFYIFARSASPVTYSEKGSINTNRKSTTCFLISLRCSKRPQGGGSETQKNVLRIELYFT